jgi:ribose/xylose/arabinose/galactoside ABC-type transport system permease subunit
VNDLVLTPGFFIAVIIVVAAVFFLHRTRTGRTIYAIGGASRRPSSWACASPARAC